MFTLNKAILLKNKFFKHARQTIFVSKCHPRHPTNLIQTLISFLTSNQPKAYISNKPKCYTFTDSIDLSLWIRLSGVSSNVLKRQTLNLYTHVKYHVCWSIFSAPFQLKCHLENSFTSHILIIHDTTMWN